MRKVQLTKGYVALVDDQDYERVAQYKWFANEVKCKGVQYAVYAQRTVKRCDGTRTSLMLHRFILEVIDPKIEVDHEDADGLNCQRYNLRKATHTQNQHNQGKQHRNTSGFKGVYKHAKNKNWIAQIRDRGKTKHLGCFNSAKEAAKAYDEAARRFYGKFAVLNFK